MTDYYQSQLHNIGDLSLDAWSKSKKKLVLVQGKYRVLSTILFVAAVPVIRLLLSTIFNKSSYTLLSCSGTIRHCSHFHLIHSRTMYVFLWSQSNLLGLADRASFRCHNSYHTDMVQMFPRLLQCSKWKLYFVQHENVISSSNNFERPKNCQNLKSDPSFDLGEECLDFRYCTT